MNIPCPYNAPCIDDANSLGNFSSEEPDQELFRSSYFPNQIWDGDQDIWTACFGLCVSFISQEDADLCAQNNARICERNQQYGNEVYTCSKVCPDGTTYSFTVPAGTFWSTESQAQANALARDWCSDYINALCESIPGPGNPNPGPVPNPKLPPSKEKACNDALNVYLLCPDGRRGWNVPECFVYAGDKFAANVRARDYAEQTIDRALGCLNEFPNTACIDDEIDRFIAPLWVGSLRRPISWEVFGILPPSLQTEARGLALRVFGKFTQAGTFGFRATLTDDRGIYSYRVYYVSVMEFQTSSPLPNGTINDPYSAGITVAGGWDPKSYSIKLTGGILPPGLDIDGSTGTISGIPTSLGTYNFTVVCTDNEGGSCEKDYQITIEDNFFEAMNWVFTDSSTAPGTAYGSGAASYYAFGAALGGSTGSGVGNVVGSWSINNTTGSPINCSITFNISRTNAVPPASGGIQYGFADSFYFGRVTPSIIVIANSLGAPGPGTHGPYAFTVPIGASSWVCNCTAGAAPAGPPFPGGTNDWTIQLART